MSHAKDSWSEPDLVEACRQNRADAWGQLVHRYQPACRSRLTRRLGQPALADQLAADAISRVWEKHLLDAFRPSARPGGLVRFVVAVAWKLFLADRRRQRTWMRLVVQLRRQRSSPAGLSDPGQSFDYRLVAQEVLARLEEFGPRLPPRLREYLQAYVLRNPPSDTGKPFSPANARQMEHLLEKLWQDFDAGR